MDIWSKRGENRQNKEQSAEDRIKKATREEKEEEMDEGKSRKWLCGYKQKYKYGKYVVIMELST